MRLGEGPGELPQGSGVRARGAHTGVRASALLHAAALRGGGLGGSLSPCPGRTPTWPALPGLPLLTFHTPSRSPRVRPGPGGLRRTQIPLAVPVAPSLAQQGPAALHEVPEQVPLAPSPAPPRLCHSVSASIPLCLSLCLSVQIAGGWTQELLLQSTQFRVKRYPAAGT